MKKGVYSFILSIFVLILPLLIYFFIPFNQSSFMAYIFILVLFFSIVSIVLGKISLSKKEDCKTFAIIGIVISTLLILYQIFVKVGNLFA